MAEEIKPRISYDKRADVLYVNFGDNEPTFTEDLDDNEVVLLEIGWFSGLPKGFRIISPKKQKITGFNFQITVQNIQKQLKDIFEKRIHQLQTEENMFGQMMNKEINEALSMVN